MGVYSKLIGVEEDDTPGDEAGTHSAGEHGGGVRGLVSGVGRQVDEILEAAARVADEIRADAEARAEEVLAARRRELEKVEDELVARVKRVEEEVSDLLSTLRDAVADLGRDPAPVVEASPAEKASSEGLAEQALLRATQLAVGGSDRAEIERVLVEQYGFTDASELLDRLLSGKRP
jgi:hypothetical protein